jgi:transcriptional regulator with XRE-family HTH domain
VGNTNEQVAARRQKFNLEVGQRIKMWRRVRGITIVELAERTGIGSDSTVSKMENGGFRITVAILAEVCQVLNVTPNQLVSGNREGNPRTSSGEQKGR